MRGVRPAGRYAPFSYGAARVQYTDPKRGIDHTVDVQAIAAVQRRCGARRLGQRRAIDERPETLRRTPPRAARRGTARCRRRPQRRSRTRHGEATSSSGSRAHRRCGCSRPRRSSSDVDAGESERDFQIRLQQSAREDARCRPCRSCAPAMRRRSSDSPGKVRTAQDAVTREQQQAQQQKLQSAVSIGATLLGALMGRKAMSHVHARPRDDRRPRRRPCR